MIDISPDTIISIFVALDSELASMGQDNLPRTLVICGGAALLSLGIVSRNTVDIDVLEPEIDSIINSASQKIGARFGLRPGWINNGPQSLVPLLPPDWKRRLVPVFKGTALIVHALGRRELIISKLFAQADRGEDFEDLKALNPKDDEIDDAEQLVKSFDQHPGWPDHVKRTVQLLKQEIM